MLSNQEFLRNSRKKCILSLYKSGQIWTEELREHMVQAPGSFHSGRRVHIATSNKWNVK